MVEALVCESSEVLAVFRKGPQPHSKRQTVDGFLGLFSEVEAQDGLSSLSHSTACFPKDSVCGKKISLNQAPCKSTWSYRKAVHSQEQITSRKLKRLQRARHWQRAALISKESAKAQFFVESKFHVIMQRHEIIHFAFEFMA